MKNLNYMIRDLEMGLDVNMDGISASECLDWVTEIKNATDLNVVYCPIDNVIKINK